MSETRKYLIEGSVQAVLCDNVTIREEWVREFYGVPPGDPVEDWQWEEFALTEAEAQFEILDITYYDTDWKAERRDA